MLVSRSVPNLGCYTHQKYLIYFCTQTCRIKAPKTSKCRHCKLKHLHLHCHCILLIFLYRIANSFHSSGKCPLNSVCVSLVNLSIYVQGLKENLGKESMPINSNTMLLSLMDFHTQLIYAFAYSPLKGGS